MKVTEALAMELLTGVGAVKTGHFVGTSGVHFNTYVAKDHITMYPSVIAKLCLGLVERLAFLRPEVVVAPAVGAIPMAQWMAQYLSFADKDRPEVLALYAEHVETEQGSREGNGRDRLVGLKDGERLIIRSPKMVLKRGFANHVKGKRVVVAEDILTTGGSALQTIQAVTRAKGDVVGVGVLVNGGKITADNLFVEHLASLIELDRKIYTEEDCVAHGLCANKVPIDTEVGHGKAFLARQK